MDALRQYIRYVLDIPIIHFVIGHWSTSFLWFSVILTAFAAKLSLMSVILHGVNLLILFVMRKQVRETFDGTIPSVALLASLVIIGLETDPESGRRLFLAMIGVVFLFLMWFAASLERPVAMQAKMKSKEVKT